VFCRRGLQLGPWGEYEVAAKVLVRPWRLHYHSYRDILSPLSLRRIILFNNVYAEVLYLVSATLCTEYTDCAMLSLDAGYCAVILTPATFYFTFHDPFIKVIIVSRHIDLGTP